MSLPYQSPFLPAPEYSIGIDLGGTSTRLGLMQAGGTMLHRISLRTRVEAGPEEVVRDIAASVAELLRLLPEGAAFRGIALGSPGPINLREGALGMLPNFPGWDHFPLRAALSVATGLAVQLESDANAAALAEWKLGAHDNQGTAGMQPIQSMCMLTLGTGVGSGIILGGSVWHGIVGMGGEVGHCSVDPNGELCTCGNRGCLELYASATGIVRAAKLRKIESADGCSWTAKTLAEQARAGNEIAIEIFEQVGYALGLAITSLINTLDLELYVIGGGVAQAWDLFAPRMFKVLEERSVVYRLSRPGQVVHREQDKPLICCASLGPDSGLLGAALLPFLYAAEHGAPVAAALSTTN